MPEQLPSTANTVLISVNPKAGRSSPMRRAEQLRDVLTHCGYAVELHTDLSVVSHRANSLAAHFKLRALVGVGGDGTAAELVNRTTSEVPITLLPAGTANLLAKQFKLPTDPAKMAQMIQAGYTTRLDVGRAGERFFLVMFSAGLDGDIVRQVQQHRDARYEKQTKKGAHISYFSYFGPIWHSMWTYRYPAIKIDCANAADAFDSSDDGAFTSITCRWPFISNLPRYGWGVTLTPQSLGNDGLLDYCFFRRGWFLPSLANMTMAQFGLHKILPNAKLGQGKAFRVTCPEQVPYQLDGDFAGYLPVTLEIVPDRFLALVPEKVAEKSPYLWHDTNV